MMIHATLLTKLVIGRSLLIISIVKRLTNDLYVCGIPKNLISIVTFGNRGYLICNGNFGKLLVMGLKLGRIFILESI